MNSLEVKNLKKYYGEKCAVSDVSFSIKSGSITALCGKNGSGKSTSIKCILNILKEDGGEIYADGEKWRMEPVNTGYLPEERGLFIKNTVYEQLMFFGRLKVNDKKKIDNAIDYYLKRFRAEEYKHAVVGSLSKGNQQKIQMIAAILHSPQLLVLDEPFSGLDPVNLNLFINILKELKESGMCILISSHQLGIVEELCENICIINGGRTVFSGSVIDLERKYGRDYLCFMTKENNAEMPKAEQYAPYRYRIPVSGKEEFKRLFLSLIDSKMEIDEIGKHRLDLQEIFISLTGDA